MAKRLRSDTTTMERNTGGARRERKQYFAATREGMKRVTVTIDPNAHRSLKHLAVETGHSLEGLTREALVRLMAERVADYIRRYSHILGRDGPKTLTRKEIDARRKRIEEFADLLTTVQSYSEFEVILSELHKVGMYPANGLVGNLATAFITKDKSR